MKLTYIFSLALIALLLIAQTADAKTSRSQAKSEKALVLAASKAEKIYKSKFSQARADEAGAAVLATCPDTLAGLDSNVSASAGLIFSYSVIGGANRDAADAANRSIAAEERAQKFLYLSPTLSSAFRMNQDNALNVSAAYLSPADFCKNLADWSKSERDNGQLLVENMPQPFKEQLAIANAVINSYNTDILKKYTALVKAAKQYRVKNLDAAAFLYGYGSGSCETAACYQIDNYLGGFVASVLPVDTKKISRTSQGVYVPISFLTTLPKATTFTVSLRQNNPRTGRTVKVFCQTKVATTGAGQYSADCLIPNRLLKKKVLLEPAIEWDSGDNAGFAAGTSFEVDPSRIK